MLRGFMKKEACASCRYCCEFTPEELAYMEFVFTQDAMQSVEKQFPNLDFQEKNGLWSFSPASGKNETITKCPFLDKKSGCVLGDAKPFSCAIWPFAVMCVGEKNALTLALDCNHVLKKTLQEILCFAKNTLLPHILPAVRQNPGLVWQYDPNYMVICFISSPENPVP